MNFFLTNKLSDKKENFIHIDSECIKMYTCGPTVYNVPHIGNLRSSVIFDILFRILKYLHSTVIYVRNITDIDDKIIEKSIENNKSVEFLTLECIKYFCQDLSYLNCLEPNNEPKVTNHINDIVVMINKLITRGFAYLKNNHVYFNINSYAYYGKLSKRKIHVKCAKNNTNTVKIKKKSIDFVLWKPKKKHEKIYFSSPWGEGRPGWHIECSAMSKKYLGNIFDIHGGGIDLTFPHHENEIAQSVCESQYNKFAKYWIHNGLLTIDGEKMSKSLKNCTTIKKLSRKNIKGVILRYFYLTSCYKKPLNFNQKALNDAKKNIIKFQYILQLYKIIIYAKLRPLPKKFLLHMIDDLNTSHALASIHKLSNKAKRGNVNNVIDMYNCCNFLGLNVKNINCKIINLKIRKLAEKRFKYRNNKKWEKADNIRAQITNEGYKIIDKKNDYELIYNN